MVYSASVTHDSFAKALEAALADADAVLAEKERQTRLLALEMDGLRLERQGLQLALARHRGEGPTPIEPPSDTTIGANEWLALSRTEAIERVLAESDEPLSPTEVTAVLHALGRSDPVHHVGAALSYLRTRARVQSLGRGRWILLTPSAESLAAVGQAFSLIGSSFEHANGSSPPAEDAPAKAAPADDQEKAR